MDPKSKKILMAHQKSLYVGTAEWCGHCVHQKTTIQDNFANDIAVVSCEDAQGNPHPNADPAVCKAAQQAGGFPAWMQCTTDAQGQKTCELVKDGLGALSESQICKYVDGDLNGCKK